MENPQCETHPRISIPLQNLKEASTGSFMADPKLACELTNNRSGLHVPVLDITPGFGQHGVALS